MTTISPPAPATPPTAVPLNTRDAARYLGLSGMTLEKWRMSWRDGQIGKGPRFLKLEGSVRYRVRDLDAFIAAGEVGASPHKTATNRARRRPALTSK